MKRIHRFLKVLSGSTLGCLAFLSGCNPISYPLYGAVPAYGIERPPGDPTVEILDFSYTPASPVASGAGLRFTATLNRSLPYYWDNNVVHVHLGTAADSIPGYTDGVLVLTLDDMGGLYDETAGDLVYSGALEWRADYGTVDSLPVIAKIDWWDSTPDVVFTGEPLTVVEPEGR